MNFEERILLEENELKPNRYVANTALCSIVAIIFVQLLNDVGAFHVTPSRMRVCSLIVILFSLFTQLVGRVKAISAHSKAKYLASFFIFVETLTICTVLTQWTELLIALPVVLSLQYHNRHMTYFSLAGSIFIALFAAPLSIYLGLPQLDFYEFLVRSLGYRIDVLTPEANYDKWYYMVAVFKYISLPRCVLIGALSPIAVYVTKLVSLNIQSRIDATYYSSTDIMTGIFNRFSFSSKLKEYEENCPDGLICIYADADGLHDLNNQFGHEAGDNMIKTAAAQMVSAFGEQTYRLGGDEFLSFVENGNENSVLEGIANIRALMSANGYHMSIGYACYEANEAIDNLVRRAEADMYAVKREYYLVSGHSRRKNHA